MLPTIKIHGFFRFFGFAILGFAKANSYVLQNAVSLTVWPLEWQGCNVHLGNRMSCNIPQLLYLVIFWAIIMEIPIPYVYCSLNVIGHSFCVVIVTHHDFVGSLFILNKWDRLSLDSKPHLLNWEWESSLMLEGSLSGLNAYRMAFLIDPGSWLIHSWFITERLFSFVLRLWWVNACWFPSTPPSPLFPLGKVAEPRRWWSECPDSVCYISKIGTFSPSLFKWKSKWSVCDVYSVFHSWTRFHFIKWILLPGCWAFNQPPHNQKQEVPPLSSQFPRGGGPF